MESVYMKSFAREVNSPRPFGQYQTVVEFYTVVKTPEEMLGEPSNQPANPMNLKTDPNSSE